MLINQNLPPFLNNASYSFLKDKNFKRKDYNSSPSFCGLTKNQAEAVKNQSLYFVSNNKRTNKTKSLKEVRKYFQYTYGIDAEFDTIAQANFAKAAVDDFVKFSGDKKCLEGLKFRTKKLKSDKVIAEFKHDVKVVYCDDKLNEKWQAAKKQGEQECRCFLEAHKPDFVFHYNNTINFNKNADLDKMLNMVINQGLSNLHSTCTIKGIFQHEIGHYLHTKSAPYECLLNKETKPCVSEVSKCAQENTREFVAEYIAGKLAGKTYSKEVAKHYLECGGPSIFDKNK